VDFNSEWTLNIKVDHTNFISTSAEEETPGNGDAFYDNGTFSDAKMCGTRGESFTPYFMGDRLLLSDVLLYVREPK
jgi:hypothetical protein